MNKIKLGSILAALLIFKGSTVLAATTSVNLHNNKNHTITVKLPNIEKDVHGIQLELTTKEELTEDIAFEPKDEDAYSFTVREGNKLKIYVTSRGILDLGQDATLGNLLDMNNEQFLDTASYRVVDYFFTAKDTLNVDVEYTEESNGSNKPDTDKPNTPDTPSNPSNPNNPDDSNQPGDTQTPSTPSINFTDTENHWASSSIERITKLGILKGYEDGTFKPNQTITKAEFAAIVVRAFGFKGTSAQLPFKDIEAGKWYTNSITALYENGIITGKPDGTFGVKDTITNQEMAVIISRIRETLGLKFDVERDYVGFKDEDFISPFAKEAVKELYEVGMINGQPDGTLNPKGGAIRAQAAVMIDRFLLKMKTN